MKKIYFIVVMCCLNVAGFAATYINVPGMTLNVASHWTSDGTISGVPAGDFITPGDVFNLNNAPAATPLASSWTLGAVALNITTAVNFNSSNAVAFNGTTVTSNSNLTFSVAGSTLTVGDGTNATSLTMTAGNLVFSNAAATLAIATGATVDMQAAASAISTYMATTIANNGTFKTANTSTTPYPAGKDFTAGNTATGTVLFYGAGNQTIIAGTYYDLATSGGSTKTTGAITVKNAFDINASTVNLGGAVTVSGNVTIGSTGTLSAAANMLTIAGNFTNSGLFTCGTGTVVFNATTTGHVIAGNLTGTSKFYKLTFNGTGGAWQFGVLGTTPVEIANTFTLAGGAVTAPSDTMKIGGTTAFTGGTFNNNGGTVYYNGTTAIQLIAGFSYYNLAFNGTTFAKNTGSTYTVANDMSITTTTGAVNIGTSTIGGNLSISTTTGVVSLGSNLTVAGSISISGKTTGNVFDATTSNYQISVAGNWTVNSTTATSLFNGRAGTVLFNGMGSQTIASTGGNVLPNFYNFRNSNTSNTVSLNNNTTIAGNMTNDMGATLNSGSTTLTVGGNWANNGNLSNSGTVIFNTTTAGHTLTGNMTGSNKFNNLSFSGNTPATWTMGSAPVEVLGDFTISGTGTVTATSDTLKISGNFNHSGGSVTNFNASTGTVKLMGTGAQTFPGAKATTFNILKVFNTSATVTANFNATINNALITVAGSNVNMSTFQLLGGFNATGHNGYLQTQNATTPLPAGLVWGGTVEYNSTAAAQTISISTYNNLKLTGTNKAKTIGGGAAVAGDLNIHTTTGIILLGGNLDIDGNVNIVGTTTQNIFDAASFQVNCGGNWTDSSTTAVSLFTVGTGTVVFDGASDQTISGAGAAVVNFNSLRNSNTSGTVTISTNAALSGNLIIDASAVLNASSSTLSIGGNFSNSGTYNTSGSQALTVGGNWSNTGAFNAGTGSVTFNTTTPGHTISGSMTGSNKFNTLTFSGNSPAAWTFGSSAADVADDFTISGTGAVTAPSSTLQIGGDFIHSAGTSANFIPNGGTVVLSSSSSQTLPGSIQTNFNTLTLSNATPRTITANGNMVIAAAFTVPADITLSMGAASLSCNSDFTNNGVYTVAGAQALSVGGTFSNTGVFSCGTGANALSVGGDYMNSGTFNAGTGTVTFNSATTGHTISGSMTGANKFNNLAFNNAAGAWSFGAATAEVGNLFTLTNGSVTAPSSNLIVTGNFVHTAGTFNHNNGTVELNGATQTIPGSATTFYDLNLSNMSGTVTANATVTIDHSLTSPSGNTLNMATSQLLGAFSAVNMAGTVLTQHSATAAPVSSGTTWGGLVNFNAATTAQTVPSGTYNNLSLSGTTSIKKNSGISTVYGDLSITTTTGLDSIRVDSVGGNLSIVATGGGTGITSLGNALKVNGSVSISGTAGINIFDVTPANYQVTVGGNWSLASTTALTLFNGRGGTVVFNGTGAQTISASSSGGGLIPNFFSFRNSNTASPISLSNAVTIAGDLTIDTGAVLNVAANAVTLAGNFLNNGTYTTSGPQTLSIKGDYTNNGSFVSGTGSVIFNATTAGHTLSGSMTGANKFNNLSFTGSSPATWTMNNSVTVDADFTISGTGTVTASVDTITVGGDFAHNAGSVTNFKANGGTVRLNGTSAQSIPGSIATTFNTLSIGGTSRTITQGAVMIVKNTLTIPSAVTYDAGTFALTDSGNFINNGTYTCAGAQALTIRGNYSNTGTFSAGTGTVAFNAPDAGHTLSGAMTGASGFYNLSFTGAVPGDWSFSDSASVGGNFTISGTGTVTAPSSVLKITGNFAHNAGSFLHNNGTVNLNGIAQSVPGSVATTFSSLTADNHVDVITLNKAVTVVAPFNIPSNVTVLAGTNAFTDSSDFTNDGIYTATGAQVLIVKGDFANTGSFTSGTGAAALTFGGSYSNTGTFTAGTSTASFNAATPGKTLSGNMTGASKFNNLAFTGASPATWIFADSAEVGGGFTISGTGDVTAPSSILKIAGNFNHNTGTFNHNNGTVYLNGAAGQTLPGTLATTFGTLSMADVLRTITLNKNITVTGALTIPSNITFAAGANSLTDSNNFTNNGTFTVAAAQSTVVTGNFSNTGTFTSGTGATALTFGGNYANTGTFNAGTGTVTFNGSSMGLTLSGNMTGSNKFNNITFNNASGGWSFGANAADVAGIFTMTNGGVTAPSSNLKITGNFVHTAGAFTHNNGTVELDGAAQSISGIPLAFYDLNLSNGSATVSDNVATTINHALVTATGSILNMGTSQLLGSFNATGHSGTLNTQYTATAATIPSGLNWGGTVNFNSTVAAQTVNAGSYNNLKTTGTMFAKNFDGAVNVAGDLTMSTTSGVISLGGTTNVSGNILLTGSTTNNIFDDSLNYAINVGGNWTLFSTSATNLFNARTGTVTFNGTGTQNINVSGGSAIPNFFNLTYSNTSSPLTLNNNVNVTGTLTVSANTTIIPAATVVFNNAAAAGSITGSGTIKVSRTATTADYANQYKFVTNTLSNMTVEYIASAAQSVNSYTYGTLRTSGSGTKTALGNLTINNLLDVNTGTTLDMGTATLVSGTAPVYSVTGTLRTAVPTSTTATPIPAGINWGGTIEYSRGAGAQTIVAGTYNNVYLGNTSGVNATGGDVTVNSALTLGKVSIGSNNLILSNGSSVSGASSTNYVVTAGVGHFRKMLSANGSYTFHIGDATNYSPVSVAMTGSGYSAAYVDAVVTASKSIHNANTNNYINRTWTISTSGIASPSWSVTSANYVAGDIVGSESQMVAASYLGSLPWSKYSAPASNTLATGSISSTLAEVSAIAAALPTVNVTPSASSFCSGNSSILTASGMGDAPLSYVWAASATLSGTTGAVVTASPTTGGTLSLVTYTVTVTDGNGNTSDGTVILTIYPQPTAITGTHTVCEGLTTTLSSTPVPGTWSTVTPSVATVGTSSGIVTGVLAGTSIISYVTAGGCYITDIVTVNQSPAAIGGTASVCEGLTTTLSNAISGGTWSTSNSMIAGINTGGVVTGVAAGNATITYTLPNGCYAVKAVTVNPLPAAITGTTVVCEGLSNTLADASAGGTWASSNTSVATMGFSSGSLTGVLAGNAIVTYTLPTGCIVTAPVTVNPSPAAITGTNGTCVGHTTTLADAVSGGTWASSNMSLATVGSTGIVSGLAAGTVHISYTLPQGCFTTRVVTVFATPTAISGSLAVCENATSTLGNGVSGGTWTSANYGVASVSLVSGVLTGIAPGTAIITYSLATGCFVTATVTVNPLPHAGMVSGPTSVSVGSMITLTDAVSGGVWSSGNANATVVGSTGVVTGVNAGTVIISYAYTNSCGTDVAPLVVTVNTSPGISGTGYVCVGATATLTHPASGGVWTTSSSAIATVGSSTGVVMGVGVGTCVVSYTVSGATSVKVVTVTSAVANITGASGACLNTSTTLSCSVPGGTWLTNNSAIATINPATGFVTGVAVGTTTITYSFGTGCYKTFTFTVRPLPAAIVGSSSACIGATTTLTDPTSGVLWTSSTPSVATIGSTSGIVTGVSLGTSTITYVLSTGCYTTMTISVNSLPAAITGTATACPGATATLSNADAGGTWTSGGVSIATVGSVSGVVTGVAAGTAVISYTLPTGCRRTQVFTVNPLPGAITGTTIVCTGSTSSLSSTTTGGTWSTSTPSVATIGTSSGLVTGISIGSSTITYTISTGCSLTTVVNVGIALSANTGTAMACTGSTSTLSNATSGGTWSSSATSVATVGTSGIVSGVTSGTATITYATSPACRSLTVVTVNPTPAAVSGANSVCINANITLSDATSGGTWSSSNTTLGTIGSTSGIVTGIATGTPVMTYTAANGCYQVYNVTVKPLPAAIVGTKLICVGTPQTLTDPTSGGVSWMSSNTSVATIGSISGVVNGVSTGTATITFNLLTGCYTTTVVTVNTTATAGTISGASSVIIGNSVTLSTTGVAGGTWTSGSDGVATVGTSSGTVTGVSAGATSISYTVNNGCGSATATQPMTVTTSRPGGSVTLADGKVVALYPNPTPGAFTIDAPEAGTLTITTLEGQTVTKMNVVAGPNALEVPTGLAAGIYMCKYTGNSGAVIVIRLVYEP